MGRVRPGWHVNPPAPSAGPARPGWHYAVGKYRTATDAIGITDSLAILFETGIIRTDLVGLTDSLVLRADYDRRITDLVGITDSIVVIRGRFVTLGDLVGITDSLVLGQGRTATDPVGLTDAIAFGRGATFVDSVGISDSLLMTLDVTTPFNTAAGTFTYNIPVWAQVAGAKFDLVPLGAGGSGQASAAAFNYGAPGGAGDWAGVTVTYGVDIPLGTTQLTVVVGAGGPAAPGPAAIPGSSGDNTTISVGSTILATGPGGGGGVGWAGSNVYGPGVSPNPYTFNGKSYTGGGPCTSRTAGIAPGGGGSGSGGFSSSYAGARGGAWIRVYS